MTAAAPPWRAAASHRRAHAERDALSGRGDCLARHVHPLRLVAHVPSCAAARIRAASTAR